MRKHFLSIVLILTGIILLIFIYTENGKIEYSETIFSSEAKSFNDSFSNFIKNVEQDFKTIRLNFEDANTVKDTIISQNFFLEYLPKNPYLIAAVLIQGDYKVLAKKEEESIVFAIDSTKHFDVVRWQRFAKKKFISSWEESLEQPIEQTSLFSNLNKNNDQIHWFLDNNNELADEGIENDELFYAGYSYRIGGVKNIILLRFSRQKLIEDFNFYKKYSDVGLLIETVHGKTMDLEPKEFKNTSATVLQNDSINVHILNHFQKFKNEKSGIFNFNFKNENYWNFFQRFPSQVGINYYLLTIANADLKQSKIKDYSNILIGLAIFIIVFGTVMILKKKGVFYKKLDIHIPPLAEILAENESRFLEFKSSSRWDYRQEKVNPVLEKVILKTIAAFGNTDGGILLIGVDDDKNIIGLEKDFSSLKKHDPDYYEIHLRNLFHKHMGVKYVSKNIRMQFEQIKNENVCKIKIFAANEPIFLKSKNKNGQEEEQFFVRSGNSSQEIKSIQEINDYINTRFSN